MDSGAPFTEAELDALFYSCMDATSQEIRRRYESETETGETEIWGGGDEKTESAAKAKATRAKMKASPVSPCLSHAQFRLLFFRMAMCRTQSLFLLVRTFVGWGG